VSLKQNSAKVHVYHGASVGAPYRTHFIAAIEDLWHGFRLPQVWGLGALRAVTNSYKKTILGPWWIPISMCFFVFGLSYLRIALSGSGRSWGDSVTFVSTGFVAFGFVSGAVLSSGAIFSGSNGVSASSAMPLSVSIFRSISTNLLDFAHDAIVIVILILGFGIRPNWSWFQLVPAICAILIFHFGLILWLGPLVCRFRDVGPIISMFQRIAIFLSPIFWSVDEVNVEKASLIKWNPYTYFITAFRSAILNTPHKTIANPLMVSFAIAFFNLFLGLVVFSYSRARLNYWATTS
jgi:ABC-2 type transport system permease protein/lipopolysaccharide transport system permease protein